jgi:hypothetical protein
VNDQGEVNDIDYVRDTMVVDVHYRVGSRMAEPGHAEQCLDEQVMAVQR